MPASRRPTLGRYLEWNGSTIRVVVHVPKPLQSTIGATKLKQSLRTDSPKAAEVLKWKVINDLNRRLQEARKGTRHDPLVDEAMRVRASLVDPELDEDQAEVLEAGLSDRIDDIETAHGYETAKTYADVVYGRATPLDAYLSEWLDEGRYSARTGAAIRVAVRKLGDWLKASKRPQTVEAVTRKVAGDYRASFIRAGVHYRTGNKDLSFLGRYWTWLASRGHLPEDTRNPWQGQRLTPDRSAPKPEDGGGNKRPFTDKEVVTLLRGIPQEKLTGAGEALPDMCLVAALTGARIGEIAALRVRHIDLDAKAVYVPGEKNDNASRLIPLHSALLSVAKARTAGKGPDEYVFAELPVRDSGSITNRASPITQAFTRARRRLKVDEVIGDSRQSRIDFHSWRRWFIAKAAQALKDGAMGFDSWTIADVVGHSKADMPLPMTMGVYAGRASMGAMRACVEAVQLPLISKPG